MDAKLGYGIGAGILLIGSIFMYFKTGTHEVEKVVDEPLDEPLGETDEVEVFGMDVLFDEKTPYILEINDRVTGDYTTPNLPFLMEGILAILFEGGESDHTTKLI